MTKNEPVGVVYSMQDGYIGQMIVKDIPHKTKLYTHPHQWQGLTDEEIDAIGISVVERWVDDEILEFARAIEQAVKEKNNVS